MSAVIVENNGITIIENRPRPQPESQGPNNIAYVGIAPEADASYDLDQPILDYRMQLVSDQWVEVIYRLP